MREVFIEAMAHHRAGRLGQAEQGYRKILAADPRQPDALHMLGVLAYQTGHNEAAVELIGRAIAGNGGTAAYHSNLGLALKDLGRLDDAAEAFRAAGRLTPNAPEPHNNLGIVHTAQGHWAEALACSATALRLNPGFADAHTNIGHVYRQQGRLAEAVEQYRKAIALRPDFAETHTSLAHALLQAGNFSEGWAEYEWRWKTRAMQAGQRNFTVPPWRGEPGNGTLLIHSEQGFGATLQFCRLAKLAASRGWTVLLEVQKPLVRLLGSLTGIAAVIGRGENLPPFDTHLPLLSLPHALGVGEPTLPHPPYLSADPALGAIWREKLDQAVGSGRRIGLAWAGSHTIANAEIDRRRSIAPPLLAPLLQIPGVNFISLQKDGPRMPAEFALIDWMAEIADFADSAALISQLDLVISVDTAVAHLAGALGKPVWLLNRFDSCWRWLHEREDSPWYPLMRIYGQSAFRDWGAALARIHRDLCA